MIRGRDSVVHNDSANRDKIKILDLRRRITEHPNMSTKTNTYPLRLPVSLKAAVEKLSKQDGTSMNQFVVMAVAEKVSAMTTADFFAERKAKADPSAFRKILNRRGGQPPASDDELPEGM
jgi:hypothetical protein